MLHALKSGPWAWVAARYVDRKVRSAFRAVRMRGGLPNAEGGLLVYCNHVGFWDGFVAHALSRAVGWDAYYLVEERTLRRYPFLRRLGGFSVRRGDPTSSLPTLRYARTLLQRPSAAVFVFPEGRLRPGASDLGELERGVEVLARASGATCLPVALRYAFLEAERPDVLVEVGEPHGPERLDGFERRLRFVVARLMAETSFDGFAPVVRGGGGAAERWDRFRGLDR